MKIKRDEQNERLKYKYDMTETTNNCNMINIRWQRKSTGRIDINIDMYTLRGRGKRADGDKWQEQGKHNYSGKIKIKINKEGGCETNTANGKETEKEQKYKRANCKNKR